MICCNNEQKPDVQLTGNIHHKLKSDNVNISDKISRKHNRKENDKLEAKGTEC